MECSKRFNGTCHMLLFDRANAIKGNENLCVQLTDVSSSIEVFPIVEFYDICSSAKWHSCCFVVYVRLTRMHFNFVLCSGRMIIKRNALPINFT